MAQVLRFFPQQAVVGKASGDLDVYSEIFDVSEYKQLETELSVHSLNPNAGTGILAVIQTNANPNLADGWEALTASCSGLTGTYSTMSNSGLLRFVRAKLTVLEGQAGMVTLEGVAKE